MILVEQVLWEKKHELEKLIKSIQERQKEEPEGSLRVVRDRKHYSYYHYMPEKRKQYPVGKYISKKNEGLIRALAQKGYNDKVAAWAGECNAKLGDFLEIYRDNKCREIYETLSKARMELVEPYELSDEAYAAQWLKEPYKGKEFYPQTPCFMTERGEKVRSKSEKILADKFHKYQIPYRYEYPLKLKSYGVVYPDFTLLNKRTRKHYYWEHFGMMDNPEYLQKAIAKIHTYEKNGIFIGKQLLISCELKNSLDMEAADSLIKEYLGAVTVNL